MTRRAWKPRVQRVAPSCLIALLAALICVVAAISPASAAAAPQLPAQGVYDWCNPSKSPDHCESRLHRLAGAGFEVVQNMSALAGGDLSDIRAFADAAQRNGIRVIWSLNSGAGPGSLLGSLPAVAAACGCTTEQQMLTYMVGVLRSYPSTWGYYIADEPKPEDHDRIAAFAERVKRLDSGHQRLIMGCGLCWGGEKSVSFLADIDAALGTDAYPVHEQGPDDPVVARRVADDAAGLQRVADRTGRKTVMALQAWRWGDSHYDSQATGIGAGSRFPTRREIQMQRDAAISHGRPELILWFVLNQVIGWEPGQRPWWWAQPPDPAQRWANLVGGAFAPVPGRANRPPVARFTLRRSRVRRKRILVDGRRSYDPDGRIVRYRWYVRRRGRTRRVCSRPRCALTVRRSGRQRVKLVVTDSSGARSSGTRLLRPSRASRRR
jgi:hypothetical protein